MEKHFCLRMQYERWITKWNGMLLVLIVPVTELLQHIIIIIIFIAHSMSKQICIRQIYNEKHATDVWNFIVDNSDSGDGGEAGRL